jgi:hypothetical protein
MHSSCEGREHESDCQPKEQAQKWFDWNGADRGTWVCKKPAKWKIPLLRGSALEEIAGMSWDGLKVREKAWSEGII